MFGKDKFLCTWTQHPLHIREILSIKLLRLEHKFGGKKGRVWLSDLLIAKEDVKPFEEVKGHVMNTFFQSSVSSHKSVDRLDTKKNVPWNHASSLTTHGENEAKAWWSVNGTHLCETINISIVRTGDRLVQQNSGKRFTATDLLSLSVDFNGTLLWEWLHRLM